MCIQPDELKPGAYVKDASGLYRIDRVKPANGYQQVVLEDALSPLTSERIPDPEVPGRMGRSVVLKPHIRSLALGFVRDRFDLVRHGPNAQDTASEAEWGSGG
jgi:hypothetical protein